MAPGLSAQQAAPAPTESSDAPHSEAAASPTQEDLQALLLTLRDPAKRDALAQQIETLLKVQQQAPAVPEEDRGIGARVLGALSTGFNKFSDALNDVGRSFGDSNRLLIWLEIQGSDPARRAMWLSIGKDLALSLGGGLLAAFVIGLGVKRARHRLAHRAGDRWFRRMRFSAARLILELLPVIAFGVVALGVIGWVAPPEVTRLALLAIVNATLISLAGAVIARFVFSPIEPGLRLVPLSDSTAVYLYIWARRLIVVGVWGYVLLETALLLGLPPSGYLVAAKLLGFVITALLIILTLQNRTAVATWIRGHPPAEGTRRIVPGAVRQRAAEIWHVAVTVYLLGIYLVWALDVSGGFLYLMRATVATLLVIAAVAAGEHWLPRLFNRFSGIDAPLIARHPLVAARANRYVPVLRRILVYAVRIVACLLILAAWRVDVGGVLFSDGGRDVMGRIADIAIVLVLALIVWEVSSGLISAHLSRRDESGYAMLRSARARTLLPLIRNVLLIVISVMATLVVLSEIGIDIAPLLAGAGVVGLAVGFGAQSLVKDVITGAFLLFEDTINIGDVIDVDGKSGVVEGMTVRSIRLRDQSGAVHTMNFGMLSTITNMTRDYSYYLIDTKVSYRYDPDEVAAALRETDEELRVDPKFKHDILMPIEVMGLETFADTSFIVRARVRTRPMRQWDVGREFNRRLKRNLEDRGVMLDVPGAPPFAQPQQIEGPKKRAGGRPN